MFRRLLVEDWQRTLTLISFAIFGIGFDYYNLMSGSGSNVAFGAHLGGFVMGLLMGTLVVPRPQSEGQSPTRWE